MYCTTCELEIKGNDKNTCPVCGGTLSDSQEADSALDNQDRKEETGVSEIFNDSESSAAPEPEPALDGSGQEEAFVLKDYDLDSLNADTAATSTGGSDELPLLNESAQGSTDNVDDLLDSIRQSIASPEPQEEDGVSVAEESSEVDSDFSFFDNDRQDSSTILPSDKTMEQGTDISWGYDEAATAVSMPEASERKRSPVFMIVLIVALFVAGGYYLFTVTSNREQYLISEDVVTAEPVIEDEVRIVESSSEEEFEMPAVSEEAESVSFSEVAVSGESEDALLSSESEPEVPVELEEAESVVSSEAVVAVEGEPVKPSLEAQPAAPVDLEEPESVVSSEAVVPVKPEPVTAPFFTVHVGSYRKRASAASEVARIKAKGYDAFTERVDLGKKGVWYRVKVGRFKLRAEAVQLQKKIQKVLVADSRVVTQQTD